MQSSSKGLYFISIGLSDEKDMSIKALETARNCDILFVELYTTKLNTSKENLEKFIGKSIRVLSREEIEEKYQKIILDEAKTKKVGLLVGGDVFFATTHIALKMEAMKQNISTKVIHGSSILSAIGETGLHLQKFGPTVTIPFLEKTSNKPPESVYEIIAENKKRNLHTLCLLDVVAENKKYMDAHEAIEILLKMEKEFKEKIIHKNSEVVVFENAGSDKSKIRFGKISELTGKKFKNYPQVLILIGNLHFTEKEYLTS